MQKKQNFKIILIILFQLINLYSLTNQLENFHDDQDYSLPNKNLLPTIQIVITIHPFNKIHYLPLSLGSIENQDYPKNRIRIKFLTERISYNESPTNDNKLHDEHLILNDQTIRMLKRWIKQNENQYNDVELSITNTQISSELSKSYWTKKRYSLMIDYKNQELYQSFETWADWLLFYDSDVIITNPLLFRNLTQLDLNDLLIVAPMLKSFGTYSNFWAGMDESGYYLRTDDYLQILDRKQLGTFSVPMVHSCVFINLNKIGSRLLTFDPMEVQQDFAVGKNVQIPFDDIIAFAKSATLNNIKLYVDNTQIWGFLPSPIFEDKFSSSETKQNLLDLEMEAMINGPEFPISKALEQYVEPQENFDTLGVNQIYVVNLARRPERKDRMQKCLKKLGIKAKFILATDGKELNESYLKKHDIRSLDGYADPYHKRPITFGEIGCFLSHYRIWEDAFRENYSKIIVLEDDVRFDHNFKYQWFRILERFNQLPEKFDFLYLGRKLNDGKYEEEIAVDQLFVRPRYSYWTIGYMITRSGIEKLLRANPLSRMIPVDEFLPIMYDNHINKTLIKMYGHIENKLEALSLRHLIISPTHYVGDPLYISDTEQSNKVSEKNLLPQEDPQEIFDTDGNTVFDTNPSGLQPPPSNLDRTIKIKHFDL